MSKVKFKATLEAAWKENTELFQGFFLLNADYDDPKNRRKLEKDFQEVGGKVKEILMEGENELCRQMEKSSNSKFSTKLSDKYWDEVRKYFKYIDMVGVITEWE